MITIEQALATGRGVERPFHCPDGKHSSVTASVNVVKLVWICYSCGARGAVDSKRVPTIDELQSMLEPEKAARNYPTSWLQVFGVGGYWGERFPLWLCHAYSLGEDPWSGEGTYPVHTPRGTLAGVCRRALDAEGPGPKYRYPRSWSASRTLFGSMGRFAKQTLVVLTEGAADALALREVGIPAWAVYGAGLHAPQLELIKAMQPEAVLLGYDNDEAGQLAAERDTEALSDVVWTDRIDWKGYKDPAEMTPAVRTELVASYLPALMGFEPASTKNLWASRAAAMQRDYEKEVA